MGLLKTIRRGWKWWLFRRRHLKSEPVCQWCGGSDRLEVHHIIPVHLGGPMYEPANAITLCYAKGIACHLRHGHFGDWHRANPAIRQQCQDRRRT